MRRKGLGVGLSRRGGPRLLVFDVFNVSVNVFNVVVHGVEMTSFFFLFKPIGKTEAIVVWIELNRYVMLLLIN